MSAHTPLPADLCIRPFTYAEARAAGMGGGRLRGADLHVPYHGVRHPSGEELTLQDRCAAFQLRMPQRAFFNSVTAARLLSVPLPLRLERGPDLHVAVPTPTRALNARGIIGHKVTLIGDDYSWRSGLRVSSPRRTWCDLSTVLSLPELVAAGDFIVHWRLPMCTIADLASAISQFRGRRGMPALKTALGLLNNRAESPKESELRVIITLAGLVGFEINFPIMAGGYRYRGDIAFPREKVLLEYLGDHHRSPEQWRRDVARATRVRAEGWFIFEFTDADLQNPGELVRCIRAILMQRAGGSLL